MKISVVSKYQKAFAIIMLVVLLSMEIIMLICGPVFFFGDAPAAIKEPETYIPSIIAFAVMVIVTVILFVVLAFNVVIDENGITLNRGSKAVRHFLWDEVSRVETYDILNINVLVLFRDKFVRVLFAHGVIIRFGYDEQALDLIKQYYKGNICSQR